MPDERAEIDPYAPPSAGLDRPAAELDPAELAEAEAVRRRHIVLESGLRGLGIAAYIFSLLFALFGFLFVNVASEFGNEYGHVVGALVSFGLAVLSGFLAHGLRGLRGWARWLTVMILGLWLGLSAVGGGVALAREINRDRSLAWGELAQIVALLIVVLIQAYLLSVLLSERTRRVCSPDYRRIIPLTPRVRTGWGLLVKVLLGVALVALVAVLIAMASMLQL